MSYSADYVHNILDELSHVRGLYQETKAKVDNVQAYCRYGGRDIPTIYTMLKDDEEKRP